MARQLRTKFRSFRSRKKLENGSSLHRLPFFHSYFHGGGERKISSRYSIWADASTTFVIKLRGEICGVVGADITGNCLLVRQLQGVSGANYRGVDAGNYLLSCAEQIAVALELEQVAVRVYQHPKQIPAEDTMVKLCVRKGRIYNEVPRQRGYEFKYSHLRRWCRWELTLWEYPTRDLREMVTQQTN